MTKEELIRDGNIAVRNAIADMFMIANSKNQLLSRAGDDISFSDSLECSPECSTMLFGDEDTANETIDGILRPQEDDDFVVIKCTKFNPEDNSLEQNTDVLSLDGLEIDDEDGNVDKMEDISDVTSEKDERKEMTLDDAIEHAKDVASKMREENPDCSCADEHEQLANWLTELKSLRDMKGENSNEEG